jgi:hypothetical protein
MIPAEAVEAAAKAAGLVFNEPANARDIEYIRTILEAAAPHIRAQALEVAAKEIIAPGASSTAAAWLIARAAELRSK